MDAFDVTGIDHVVLRVADVPRALAFYQTVLGLRLERQQPEIGLWQLRAGAALLDLWQADGRPSDRNMDHVALAIRPFDRDRVQAHLALHNVAVEGGSPDNYGAGGSSPALYISDPEGNMIELMGPGAGDLAG